MNVQKILNLMGLIGIGNDNISDSDKAIYLHYLNLAHLELYNYVAEFNEDVLKEALFTTEPGQADVILPDIPVIVNMVYLKDSPSRERSLAKKNYMEFIDIGKKDLYWQEPSVFTSRKNVLSIYPVQMGRAYNLSVWYSPQPNELEEFTPEDDIPYPVSHHPVLLNGALYYLFLDDEGFKSSGKAEAYTAKWETGKSQLLAYLTNRAGYNFSTYNNTV